MILTCALLTVAMCATGLAEDKKTDKGKHPARVEGKKTPMPEKRAMNILKQIEAKDPALAKKLLEIKKTNPKKFREELSKAAKKYNLGKGSALDGHREKMRQWEQERNAEYIAWLKKNYPEEAARLEKIQKDTPRAFNRQMRESRKIYVQIMDMMSENPKIAENMKEQLEVINKRTVLIKRAASLANEIKKAKGPKRDKLVKQLKDTLSIRIDLIVVLAKLKYEVLEEKIKQLNIQIAKQKKETEKFIQKKDEEIAKRMERLLKEDKAN
jgi:hypothetical protein